MFSVKTRQKKPKCNTFFSGIFYYFPTYGLLWQQLWNGIKEWRAEIAKNKEMCKTGKHPNQKDTFEKEKINK